MHALAGLARCYVETGALEQAKQTLALVPEAKRNEAPVAAARAALEVAEQAKSLGPLGELEEKVARQSARPSGALRSRASRSTPRASATEAADHLLEIVKRDRKWNDDGARKQLVQFFEAWGPTDEATVEGRKRLSSILFSVSVRVGAATRRAECDDADERDLSRADRSARRHPGVSAAGRAAVAARPDAAQHFRAALSRDDRRRAARRPSADRHDPARPAP